MIEDFDVDVISYDKTEQWVEISTKNNCPMIRFYPSSKKEYWEFSLEDAILALEKAKKILLEEE